jgi:prepilin-type N-terminal cleavage/methylation domain-containing protein
MWDALRKKAAKIDGDESGFTLIEVISSLLILGMVVSILYSFMLMGISMYKKVSAETQLRNQANLIFGGIVEELRGAVYADADDAGPTAITVVKAKDGDKYVEEYKVKFVYDEIRDPLHQGSQFFVSEGTPGVDGIRGKELKLSGGSYKMEGTFTIVDDKHDAVIVDLKFTGSPVDRTSGLEDAKLTLRRTIPLFRIE